MIARFTSAKRLIVLINTVWLLVIVTACDPQAPDPTSVAILRSSITPVPSPTSEITLALEPTLTLTPSATLTYTPRPTRTAASTTATPLPSTATPFDCATQQGQLVDLTFNSTIARQPIQYRVYLPPCYTELTRRYPYVILMHGLDQDETEWTDLLKVNQTLERGLTLKALPPMILVMPNGNYAKNDLFSSNTFAENKSWEYIVINELIPDVERNFCTWNVREGRAIGGISRGGFWAYLIGLRHTDVFSAIGGHSPTFDVDHVPRQFRNTHNPLFLADLVKFLPGMQPRLWLDVGADDATKAVVMSMRDKLTTRKIAVDFTLNPSGGHNTIYWSAHVGEYLSFYGLTWPRNAEDLPNCLN